MAVYLHTANRFATLADALAAATRDRPDPFRPETIVVPSRHVAAWLTFHLARRHGIALNLAFPFLPAFVNQTARMFFPDLDDGTRFAPQSLVWRILGHLPRVAAALPESELRAYLGRADAAGPLKAWQLAERVAGLFADYQVRRPALLAGWESGVEPDDWQAGLWRALRADPGPEPLSAIAAAADLGERLTAGPPPPGLPARVAVFHPLALPPFYLDFLFFLGARHAAVHLFALRPSRQYYGHDRTPAAAAKAARRGRRPAATAAPEALFPGGNALLTALGKAGRDLTDALLDAGERHGASVVEATETFTPAIPAPAATPGGALAGDGGPAPTLLAAVQDDVLEAREPGIDGQPRIRVWAGDRSLTIHSCHSPLREIEVLHDCLLDHFERIPDLAPRDVLVLCPDLERYAPLLAAVFRGEEEDAAGPRTAIPFAIRDRAAGPRHPVAAEFLALLELPDRRCGVPELLDHLDHPAVRATFGLSADDLATVREWVRVAGIRWGIDGDHRARCSGGGPPGPGDTAAAAEPASYLTANTWAVGLDRLLLGVALPARPGAEFAGIIPADPGGLGGTGLLGRFLAAANTLLECARQLATPRPVADWPDLLAQIADRCLGGAADLDPGGMGAVRGAIAALRATAAALPPLPALAAIPAAVMRRHLENTVAAAGTPEPHPAGGVTFAAFRPGRITPARIICLLGLDDGAVPRRDHAPEFDRVRGAPQPGDIAPRDEDRALFLEALATAGDALHLSYRGRSLADNAPLPPSLLVAELLDYLDRTTTFSDGPGGPGQDGPPARAHLVTEHALHGFSGGYFAGDNPRRFSFSRSYAAAARALQAPPADPVPFVAVPLPPVPPGELAVDRLADFFADPLRYFARERLGIELRGPEETEPDSELFALDQLDAYRAKTEIGRRLADPTSAAAIASTWRELVADGLLPLGSPGRVEFATAATAARRLQERLRATVDLAAGPTFMPVDLPVGGWRLTGAVGPLYGDALVRWRPATIKPADRLRLLVLHLVRAAGGTAAAPAILLGEDEICMLGTDGKEGETLARFVARYAAGLARPLPFFPAAAYAYAKPAGKTAKTTALDRARTEFDRGAAADDYVQLFFGPADPLAAEFERLAAEIFGEWFARLQ